MKRLFPFLALALALASCSCTNASLAFDDSGRPVITIRPAK